MIRLSALFSRCIFTSFFGLSVSWFRDFSGLYWGLKFIYQNGLFSNVFESFLMISASSHALFCADCTMECMKYQIFVQKKNYIASVFFKVFIWMFEQDYIFFFTSIEEKKWLNHFLCKYFKKVVEANIHLICIMKLEPLIQLEITIKAQLNKMYGYMIMKKYIFFFSLFFLKKILYLWHCAVVASKRARKQWPGPVSCQQAHTPKLQCSWLALPRVILDKLNKSDFLEKHPISLVLLFYLFLKKSRI